jgi:hypothetical protein
MPVTSPGCEPLKYHKIASKEVLCKGIHIDLAEEIKITSLYLEMSASPHNSRTWSSMSASEVGLQVAVEARSRLCLTSRGTSTRELLRVRRFGISSGMYGHSV